VANYVTWHSELLRQIRDLRGKDGTIAGERLER